MKKICLLVPSLTEGGGVPTVARFLKDVINASNNYTLKVVSLASSRMDPNNLSLTKPKTWIRGALVSSGTWEGEEYVHVGANLGEFEFQRYKPRKILSNIIADCDFIQVVCGGAAWANSVLGLGKPVSIQVATRTVVERQTRDSENGKLPISSWRRLMTRCTDVLDDIALTNADAVQVENRWMYEYVKTLNKSVGPGVEYAPPGVDSNYFVPAKSRGLEEGYILCVGRLDDPRKNIGLLVKAYSRLSEYIKNRFKLVLAGSSGPTQAVWDLAETLLVKDRIEYVAKPSNEQLRKIYQKASVFALSSNEEGLGMVILEAMACGVPAVCTLCGGPDGIIKDGEDGFLVPLGDENALSRKIESVLNDPEKNMRLGIAARKTIESRYSKEVSGMKFVDIWERMLQSSEV